MTLEKLKEIARATKDEISLRFENPDNIKITVAMDECGISAGARDILLAFFGGINELNVKNALLFQSGCMGSCGLEPMAKIEYPNGNTYVYVNLTADKAREIVEKHLLGGAPVEQYLKAEGMI